MDNDGLICAFRFSSETATRLDAPEPETPEGAWQWTHWNRDAAGTRQWLEGEAGLPELAAEEMLDIESRPGVSKIEDGILLRLRGVNLNEGAEPDAMISLHLWIEPHRLITVRSDKVFALDAARRRVEKGHFFPTIGALIAEILEGMTDRAADVVEALEDRVDEFELLEIAEHTDPLRSDVTDLRRDVVNLRRFLMPQRDAVAKLATLHVDWIDEDDRQELGVVTEDLGRITEMLSAVRERAMIIQETIDSDAAARMNRTMYMLSMVATIFLPLSFVTGLLGINVGGIPGTRSSWAFEAVCAALLVVGAVQVWLFRKLRMF